MSSRGQAGQAGGEPGLIDLLTLERIEADLFRSAVVHDDRRGLYGGQVAAQALAAAAATVPDGRHPHSLHGYFLSRGDPARRVLLMVSRDRDGRSYSNRRVIAVQGGVVIFNMAASFHVLEDGPDYQAHALPRVSPPERAADISGRVRLLGIEVRVPEQASPRQEWPSRVWMRSRDKLGVPAISEVGPVTSIDHAVWFYRRARLDEWVLMDLRPESTAGGRGMYTGRIFGQDGTLVAGIAQESLFRPGRARPPGPLAP